MAEEFRTVFCPSGDDDQALWCLQCLHNTLAHGALSLYQMSDEDDGPTPAYLPTPKSKNHLYRHCPGSPCTDT